LGIAECGWEKETPKSGIQRGDALARNPANGETSGPQAEFSGGKGIAKSKGGRRKNFIDSYGRE
jgi:hypothetical protein